MVVGDNIMHGYDLVVNLFHNRRCLKKSGGDHLIGIKLTERSRVEECVKADKTLILHKLLKHTVACNENDICSVIARGLGSCERCCLVLTCLEIFDIQGSVIKLRQAKINHTGNRRYRIRMSIVTGNDVKIQRKIISYNRLVLILVIIKIRADLLLSTANEKEAAHDHT